MDGEDAPLARQDDDGVRGAASPLDSATVVVDPTLPKETRAALLAAGRKLVPYRGPVPSLPSPARGAHGCMSLVALFFVFAILGTAGGNYVFASMMIMLAASGVPIVLASRPTARDIAALRAPFTEHRRYVLPSADIDAEHWKLWKRAVDARNRIAAAGVVGEGRIDSVHIGEVLPQRLWDVAERLARLAEVRARQREILGDLSPDDPDVAQAVTRQRRAQELALADVERRVSDLERVAGLVDAADLLARKESVVRELNALDDTHAELLAGIGDTQLDADVTHRLADEATAVMEQARQAIAQANEAALTLAPPGEEPAGRELAGQEPAGEEAAGEEPAEDEHEGDQPEAG